MRVLIHPSGSHGDVLPFISLAQEFRERGHDARLYAPAIFADFALDKNIPFKGLGSVESHEALLRDPAISTPMGALKAVARGIDDTAQDAYTAMDADASDDCIIVGSTLAFAARSVAEHRRLPIATVHLAPSAIRSLYSSTRFSARPVRRTAPMIKRGLMFVADALAIDPTIGAAVNRHRRAVGLPPARRVFDKWLNRSTLVIGMFPDWFADPQRDWPTNLRLTDFPFDNPATAPSLPAELENFLDDGPPPIGFTIGTASADGREFFAASAQACQRTGTRGILLTRHADQIPSPLPPGVVHFRFVPFVPLLPRLAGIVHHGGVGTTSQAFRAGVPQLIRPAGFDQFDNSAHAVALGVAIELAPESYDVENASTAISRFTSDTALRERCAELAKRVDGDGIPRTCEEILAMASR